MIHLLELLMQISIRANLGPGEARRNLINTGNCVPEPEALTYIPRNRFVDSPVHLLPRLPTVILTAYGEV
jgi:hypothetical protein